MRIRILAVAALVCRSLSAQAPPVPAAYQSLYNTLSTQIAGFDAADSRTARVLATPATGDPIRFEVRVRIDTPKEREYFRHGGILHYVLRQLASQSRAA